MLSGTSISSLTIQELGFISSTINEAHFGTNMLFHTDRTNEGSDFEELITSSGITSIRYPGGTIAEQFFDPSNPNHTTGYNFFDTATGQANVGTREILPLSDYLSFIESINGTATIVFPTYRYFDQNTRTLSFSAEAEISEFFTALLSGEYGSLNRFNLELGNEWYQSNFNWTAAEFGHLQAEIARIISETAEALGLRDTVDIFAQGDANASDNMTLASFFDGAYNEYIDGVLAHIYGANSQGNPLGIGGAIQPRLDEMMGAWDSLVDIELLLAITEWNVGESGADSTLINGLMRSAPLIRMFAEMMQANVDVAHIWSTQTAGPAGLSGREGTGSEWSPTGYLYNMLYDAASGSQLVDTGASFRLRDDVNTIIGYTYTFSQSGNTNIFFSSAVGYEVSLEVDLVAIMDGASHVYVSVLTAAPGFSGTEYNTEAALEFLTGLTLADGEGGTDSLSLLLGAYETLQISVTYGSGVEISADQQVAIADELLGSEYDDTIHGGLGDDILSGFGGRDLLYGGNGNDSISGGNHHDTIFGGSGDDSIEGDAGKDSIVAGSGDDYVSGGDWHDSIWGGTGSDSLYGDGGNDEIYGEEGDDFIFGGEGNDTLDGGLGINQVFGGAGNDFIIGNSIDDIIDGGLGVDTLSFAHFDAGITVWTGHGVVELDFGEVEFIDIEVIETTEFADRVSLAAGIDFVSTYQGDDSLEVWGSQNAIVDMGDGNDMVYSYDGNANQIYGGDGEDFFFILYGSNTYFGGGGDDLFYLFSPIGSALGYREGDGHDVLIGFTSGRDSLFLEQSLEDDMTFEITQDGTVIRFGSEASITLLNTFETNISDSFEFL